MASVWSLLKKVIKHAAAPGSSPGSLRPQSNSAKTAPAGGRVTREQQVFDESMSWLGKRWAMAQAEEGAAKTALFPSWYFQDATERQIRKIQALGLHFPPHASKGQFSDVIGLFQEPDSDDLEKLKFFGIKLLGKDRNETRVRHEIAIIDADPASARRWSDRPASRLQLEFFKFHGLEVPPALTSLNAESIIKKESKRLPEDRKNLWIDFCHIVDEFNDPEFRETEEIRKPSLSKLRAAFDALVVDSPSSIDATDVATYLLQHHPELAQKGS